MNHISQSQLLSRVVEPSSFVADPNAFVDVRLPRSKGKESFSFIGPGVSQNANQVINIVEPHGFNVGAARLPGGAVNNPHLHFTAEVFICTSGSFRFRVGLGEGAVSIDVGVGDVLSVPTWVFRSFENIGTESGFVYTALGKDSTGGIIWAPNVLSEAAETGLHLDRDASLIDTVSSDSLDGVELMPRMSDEDIRTLRQPSAAELAGRLVKAEARQWTSSSLLSGALRNHEVETAPIIGYGFTQLPNITPPIAGHHSFSATWLRAKPGNQTGVHAVGQHQVGYVIDGQWRVDCNLEGDATVVARPGTVISLPPNTWRNLGTVDGETATMVLVTAGDCRPKITWAPEVVQTALDRNFALDANGCVGPAHLILHRGGSC